ncbi:MAG: prepilin peptidase [Cryobacterium sp.]|nr:prepilin peptidase [Oligoflexia bacterium]
MVLFAGAPEWFLNVWVTVIGLLIGSFLNVVIARLPERKSLSKPRSHCPKCGYPLRWFDNIPVLSYLFLRGKCRSCSAPISVRYPVVELLTGLLFLTVKLRFGFTPLLFVRDFPFVAILIAITFIDLETRLIPDPLNFGGLAIGLATAYFTPGIGLPLSIGGAALGFLFFYGIAWFYQWRTGRAGMGGGDIKFLAMIGAFLGPFGVMTTVFMSSVLGTVLGLSYAWIMRKKSGGSESLMKVSLPFGPFLVIGALYSYLLGDLLWSPFMNLM